jgi:hypothetical protein
MAGGAAREKAMGNHSTGFLKSPAGLAMIAFMAIGAFLVFTEHRPHVFVAIVWAAALACPLMHLFHGHGRHAHRGQDANNRDRGDRD